MKIGDVALFWCRDSSYITTSHAEWVTAYTSNLILIRLLILRAGNPCRGYAFVTMEDPIDAATCVKNISGWSCTQPSAVKYFVFCWSVIWVLWNLKLFFISSNLFLDDKLGPKYYHLNPRVKFDDNLMIRAGHRWKTDKGWGSDWCKGRWRWYPKSERRR